jgi:hypothetical protein
MIFLLGDKSAGINQKPRGAYPYLLISPPKSPQNRKPM